MGMHAGSVVRFMPNIYRHRPDFFGSLCAQFIVHLGMGAACLIGRFNFEAELWVWFGGDLGVRILGLLNLAIAIAVLHGIYYQGRRFNLALNVSVFAHALTAIQFLNAFFWPSFNHSPTPFSGARLIFFVVFTGLSVYSLVNCRNLNTEQITISRDLL
jgi:hypothetical protein